MQGQGNLTPTQVESIERSKAFKAKIAEAASRLADQKTIEALEASISNEAMPEAYELPPNNQFGPRIDVIVRAVADHFSVSYIDIVSARRTSKVILPRHVAMYLAKTLTLRSLPEIGRRIGGRDHTVVLYAQRKIEGLIRSNPDLAEHVRVLTEELTG
jgi:chromosomal replication initiation ATPase DnaA